jgi:hypothetical protein
MPDKKIRKEELGMRNRLGFLLYLSLANLALFLIPHS